MAFQNIADLDADVTVALGGKNKQGKANPTTIEGYFIGTRKVESPKAKSGFCSLHIIQTEKGNVGVWGKTNLDQKLLTVTPGNMIRVSFVGMVETRNNPMYKYKVEVDKDNSIDVSTTDSATDSTPEKSDTFGYDDDAGDDSGLDDSSPQPDELPPARAKAPAQPRAADPARAAQVNALLNRGGRRSA